MPDGGPKPKGGQNRLRQRKYDGEQNSQVACPVDFGGVLQLLRNAHKEVAKNKQGICADQARDNQGPSRIDEPERFDQEIGGNKPSAKKHRYNDKHHVKIAMRKMFLRERVGSHRHNKQRQETSPQRYEKPYSLKRAKVISVKHPLPGNSDISCGYQCNPRPKRLRSRTEGNGENVEKRIDHAIY